MCGRFNLIDEVDYIGNLFNTTNALNFPNRYNITPMQPVMIIKNMIDGPAHLVQKPEMKLVQWGFVPDWMKEPPKKPIINARIETVREKPSFRGAVEQNRCIVPASAWYEWKTINGVKQPFLIKIDPQRSNQHLLAFAGIYSHFMAEDGSEMETMAILTQAANDEISHIHHRMPVLLNMDQYEPWLNGYDVRARRLLTEMDKDAFPLTSYPISRKLGDVRFDDISLLDEIEAEELPQKKADQLSLF